MTYNSLLKTIFITAFLIVVFLIYNQLFIINEEFLVAITFLLFVYLALLLLTNAFKASIFSKALQIKNKFYDIKPIIKKERKHFFNSVYFVGNNKSYDNLFIDYYHIIYNFINEFKLLKRTNNTQTNILTNKLLKRSYNDLKIISIYDTLNHLRIELVVLLYLIHLYVHYIPTIFLSYIRNFITNKYNDLYVMLYLFVKYKKNKYYFTIYKTIIRELFKKIYRKK